MKKRMIVILFVLLIFVSIVASAEPEYVGEVVSSKTVENIDDSEPVQKFGISGLGSISFDVSSSKTLTTESVKKTSLNTSVENVYEFSNLRIETIYEEVDTGFFNVDERPIKQSFRLTNLLDEDVEIEFDVKYEINADKVMWNGTEYEIAEIPKFFEAFDVYIPELERLLLVGYILYFDNNYFSFKDVTNLDYTVSVYSEGGRNYIVLGLNLKFGPLETITIDPEIGWSSHIIENYIGVGESVFATDINRDDNMDVVAVSGTGDRVAWYKNDGGRPPSWIKYVITESISYGRDGCAADVNGDGHVDVLSASSLDDKVAWYKNPSWTPYIITTDADSAWSVFATDLDKDGDTDVLSASGWDDKVAWYENDGSEHFTEHVITSSADGATDVFAIDINGDNEIDVISTSSLSGEVVWYKNDGNEHFTEYLISVADNARAVYAIDVDGDNLVDVLSASETGLVWYKNNGGSTPTWTKHIITTPSNLAWDVFATDMDNDGNIDVLGTLIDTSEAVWYKNDGNEHFTKYLISSAFDRPNDIFASDLDNDGDMDVITGASRGYELIWHESDLSQAPPKPKLKVLAVPIRWTRSNDEFKTAFNEALDIFLRQLELNNCKDRVYIEWVDVSQSLEDFHCCFSQYCINQKNTCQVNIIRNYVTTELKKNPQDFNFVAGLIDENSFAETGCITLTRRTDGCRNENIIWANENYEGYKHMLAHEIGHVFGLEDEYCSNPAGSTDCNCNDAGSLYWKMRCWPPWRGDPNPLDLALGCDASEGGNCCEANVGLPDCDPTPDYPTGYRVCCLGNENAYGGRAIMSYTRASKPRWFDVHSVAHLNTKDELRCD